MKKRLLLQLVALFCAVAGYAYEAGDYIYTPTSKFKVLGANLFVNGNFANSLTGWTDAAAGSPDASTWLVAPGIGPNGEAAVVSQGANEGAALVQAFTSLQPGTYIVTYDIKGENESSSVVVTTGANNYVDFFINLDGSLSKGEVSEGYPKNVATGDSYNNTEWRTVTDTVTINSGEILVFHAEKVLTGVAMTNFSLHQIKAVYDTRIIERRIAYAEMLAGRPEFSIGLADILDEIDYAKTAISGEGDENPDDEAAMVEVLGYLNDALTKFLDDNSGDILTGEPRWSALGDTRKQNGVTPWSGEGGRWFHGNNGVRGAGYDEIGHRLQGGMAAAYASQWYPTKALFSGTYMFSIDVQGYYMSSSSSTGGMNYVENWAKPFTGVTVYAGKDILKSDAAFNETANVVKVDCGQINNRFYTTYTIFVEAQEGETINFGMTYIPAEDAGSEGKLGSNVMLANPEIRVLGHSNAEVVYIKMVNKIKVQQNALAERLELAKADYEQAQSQGVWFDSESSLDVPNMPWGREALKDSIQKYQPVYDASLAVINADGVDLNPDMITEEYEAELLAAVQALNSARNNFKNANTQFNTLVDEARTSTRLYNKLLDKGNQNLRIAFVEAINSAIVMIQEAQPLEPGDELTETQAAFTAKYNELIAAKEAYWNTAANFDVPAQQLINNPFFASNVSGWTLTANDAGKEAFKRGNSTDRAMEHTTFAAVWRGQTASPQSKFIQQRSFTNAGVYEYRSSAYAFNEGTGSMAGYDLAMLEIITDEDGVAIDTLFTHSECKMLFGPVGAPDSVRVHSHYYNNATNGTTYTGYRASKYSVVWIKTDDEPTDVEFGMCTFGQIDRAGANTYGFGDNEIFFAGEPAAYLARAKEELNTLITAAKALQGGYDDLTAGPLPRLVRHIRHAEEAVAADNIQDILNRHHDLKEAMKDVDPNSVPAADGIVIPEVRQANDAAVASGIYTVTGVKVAETRGALKNLPKGLYIINGKKYMIK